jgi:glutamate racemase
MIRNQNNAIGIFDSGIGGLTVANAIFDLLPNEELLYFGDTAHIPYGTKSAETIRQYCLDITDYLLQQDCKAIVVACNTASAAALESLRQAWPNVPIIGMEPAVKPAVKASKSGKIGVLATAGTFDSERYENLVERFAEGKSVFENPCLGLVEKIEAGMQSHPETIALLSEVLQPMLDEGVDTFVLGCTHYPIVRAQIQSVAGPEAHIINPAPAVAKQLKKRLEKLDLLRQIPFEGKHQFLVSKYNLAFENTLKRYGEAPYSLSEIDPSKVFSNRI